ncbi:MAG TPA: hypothetical protein VFX97_13815 [Pyrinomonadaceae bacterium]|nr:hypothetical protein [Pyrinomonadaceae bacterium]
MKLRITHLRSQVLLTSIALIAISIACSASKSADSPAANAANVSISQPLTSPSSSITQDKPPCTLTLSAAPSVNGIRLGMTPDEVLALFPGSKDDPAVSARLSRPPNQFNTNSLLVRPEKYETKAEFAGISQITFSLFDGRVSKFYVSYNGPEWPHVDKFVEKFVEGKNLPAVDQWETYAGFDNQKALTCVDFSIRVFSGGPGGSLNHMEMQDLEADKKLKERMKKAQEQASPTPGN